MLQAGTKSTWLSWPYLAMQLDHTPSPEPQTLFEPFWLKARGFAHSCRILVVAASGHCSAKLGGQRRGLAERALHDPTVPFFDLQDEGPQEKRPKGEQAAAEHVTMDSIRTLLQELSVSILQAQQTQLTMSLKAFEDRQAVRMNCVEGRVETKGVAMDGIIP